MGQIFEPYEPDQGLLLPPSLDDWLPEEHLARFISDTVDQLDLKPFLGKYKAREDGRGRLAFHPRMMLKVLIYSYCEGIFSSRKIAKGIENLGGCATDSHPGLHSPVPCRFPSHPGQDGGSDGCGVAEAVIADTSALSILQVAGEPLLALLTSSTPFGLPSV